MKVHMPANTLSHLHAVTVAQPPVAAAVNTSQGGVALSHAAATAVATAPLSAKAMRQQHFTQLAARYTSPILLSQEELTNKPLQVFSLKVGGIGISNFDEQVRVNFAIKSVNSDWQDEYLDPAITREFQCGFPDDCLFWMQTGSKPAVYYKMHTPARYAIFWDEGKELWDLKIAREGN